MTWHVPLAAGLTVRHPLRTTQYWVSPAHHLYLKSNTQTRLCPRTHAPFRAHTDSQGGGVAGLRAPRSRALPAQPPGPIPGHPYGRAAPPNWRGRGRARLKGRLVRACGLHHCLREWVWARLGACCTVATAAAQLTAGVLGGVLRCCTVATAAAAQLTCAHAAAATGMKKKPVGSKAGSVAGSKVRAFVSRTRALQQQRASLPPCVQLA